MLNQDQNTFLRGNRFQGQDNSQLFKVPRSKSRDIFHDRFIPEKVPSNYYNMLANEQHDKRNNSKSQPSHIPHEDDLNPHNASNLAGSDINETLREENSLNRYTSLLKYNILSNYENQENLFKNNNKLPTQDDSASSKREKVFKYKRNTKRQNELIFSYSPLKFNDIQNYIVESDTSVRKIQKQPYKILDAPKLKDDFYHNLLSWSSKNIITIGLDNSIYTWSAKTNEAFKLAEFPQSMITSLNWHPRGVLLASGDDKGDVRIFDTERNKAIRTIENHRGRVGTLAWCGDLLTTGGRDGGICVTDLRSQRGYVCKFTGHKQEVCGTKWCFDGHTLASGGNDNKVFIWDLKMQKEITRFGDHVAAVKALDWSPHQYHLLATGGGTSDKCLKFWNINTLKLINSIDTGSQICNMHFSKNCNEIVTTHGFSMNQVTIWKCQYMQRIATFYGHTQRVLYLAASPDGENIVTGSGDETLRFWRAFPPGKSQYGENIQSSNLDPLNMEIR